MVPEILTGLAATEEEFFMGNMPREKEGKRAITC